MKNKAAITVLLCSITIMYFVLNINVSTNQGVNFKVHSFKIPLFLKVVGFMDRHYHYKQLVRGIVDDKDSKQQKAMKLFIWTHKNIRRQPESLPVIDDHVWNIIIRGYGLSDQYSDVFTTLCNYAGVEAFFKFFYDKDKISMIPLSFVKLNNLWIPFDPYHGVYFEDNNGSLADIQEIKKLGIKLKFIDEQEGKPYDYQAYFEGVPDNLSSTGLERAQIQSPIRRFIFGVKKWVKRN